MGDGADDALDRMMDMDELQCRYQDFDDAEDNGVAELLYDYDGTRFPHVFSSHVGMKYEQKREPIGVPVCPYCGSLAELVDTATIYHGKSYGWAWKCPSCADVYCGCHKGTKKPLGTMANATLRRRRMEAHVNFDPLWRSKRGGRTSGYKWLADQLSIPVDECHIGSMNVEQCNLVVQVCRAKRNFGNCC
jgi:hypothetical protein